MKHSSIVLTVAVFMAMLSVEVKAQGLVYTPFIPESSSSSSGTTNWGSDSGYSRPNYGSNHVSSQTQTIRTTAYYADYEGYYYKVPIRVEYTVYSYGSSSLMVAEQWETTAFGGQWKKLPVMANVEKCRPITAYGVNAYLEKNFMYKAMVGTRWYYFDL